MSSFSNAGSELAVEDLIDPLQFITIIPRDAANTRPGGSGHELPENGEVSNMCMPDYCQEHCDMSLDEAIEEIHNAPGKYFKIGAHVVSNCRKFDLDVFCLLITCTYIYIFFFSIVV